MKAERIELPGGYYVFSGKEIWRDRSKAQGANTDDLLIATALDGLGLDRFAAAMNAPDARVQLLAKALRAYEQHHDDVYNRQFVDGVAERANLGKVRHLAKAALTEAGIESESK